MSNQDTLNKLKSLRYDPWSVWRYMADKIDRAHSGQLDIVDPNNPFVHLLDANALTAAAGMQHTESITRKLYPSLAVTEDDLYHHMSDEDYVGRFAGASSANIIILLPKQEIINNAVSVPGELYRKLVFPEHSQWGVAEYNFMTHYPIEIQVADNDAIRIYYDTTKRSPLRNIASNVAIWDTVNYPSDLGNIEYIRLVVPCTECNIASSINSISASLPIDLDIDYTNKYLHCRVYNQDVNGGWVEMHTTHSDQVYDPAQLTAVLKVTSGKLNVSIPLNYQVRGLVGSNIRVDLYTTRGDISVNLGNYGIEQFGYSLDDYNITGISEYADPLTKLTNIGIMSQDTTTGGSNEIPFNVLRQRVISNSAGSEPLITEDNINGAVEERGYSIVRMVDDVTDRVYHATRFLPVASLQSVSSAVGTLSRYIEVDTDEIKGYDYVNSTNDRTILTPSCVYNMTNAGIELLNSSEQTELDGLPVEERVTRLNNGNYLFTPFYYVIDTAQDLVDVRAYHLDNPTVLVKKHIDRNLTLPNVMEAISTSIDKVDTGYKVTVVLSKEATESALFGDLDLQLGFIPEDESRYAFVTGVLKGYSDGELAVYEFNINTIFDVDSEDKLWFTDFKIYEGDLQHYRTDLVSKFSLFYFVKDVNNPNVSKTVMDDRVNVDLIGSNGLVVLQEEYDFEFGKALKGLHTESRSIVKGKVFDYYDTDVPWTYEDNVPKRDDKGDLVIQVVDGKPVLQYDHRKGDTVLDANGDPKIRYRAGIDVKKDHEGNPIVLSGRSLNRQFNITLFDARYSYATDNIVRQYMNSVATQVVGYLNNDIASIGKRLIENTRLLYTPKRTIGTVSIDIGNDEVITIPSDQSFSVTYHLTEEGYNDIELRKSISERTSGVIANKITSKVVSALDINKALGDAMGDEVISATIDGLGPDNRLDAYTVVDETSRSTVKVMLEVQTDGVLTIKDDVSIEFVKLSD